MKGDFLVDTPNPRALDETLQQIGAVLIGGPESYLLHDSHYVVRPFGNKDFVRFAVEHQGYAKVVGLAPDPAPWDLSNILVEDPRKRAEPGDHLANAGIFEVLDLITTGFKSDPTSVQCFDARLVARAIELADEYRSQKGQWF